MLLQEYLKYLENLNFSASMIDHSRESIQKWALYLKRTANKELLQGNDRELEQYVLMLKSQYYPSTVNNFVITLRKFYMYLKKEGAIFYSPFDFTSFKIKRSRLPKDIPNHDDVMKVLEHPNPKDCDGLRNRAILELLYSSALRNGEISNLRLSDLDLKEGVVFIREGKCRRQRLVPIGGRACEAIEKYLKKARPKYIEYGGSAREDRVFLTIAGNPMGDATVRYVVLKHRVATPRTLKMTAHSLRHACATQMLKGGSNVKFVQEMLGHSRLSTTQIYTHLNTKDLENAQRAHHPRSEALAKSSVSHESNG